MSADEVVEALQNAFAVLPNTPGTQTVTASWEEDDITVSISLYASVEVP